MSGPDAGRFALGDFLTRWAPLARHDLSRSDSETLSLGALLHMASDDKLARWSDHGLGYTDPRGNIGLREAIAARHDGLDAEHVLCCCGAQEAVLCVLQSILEPDVRAGDRHALLLLPIYQPSELSLARLCAVTGVALQEADDWQPDLDRIEAALRPETRLVLMNYPNSPTGASLDPARLDALVALCRKRGLWLVNDEIYRQTEIVQSGGRSPMLADRYERGVSINGLSKGFGLPGLRVGWIACRDQALLQRALTIKSSLSSCLAASSEILAEIALAAEMQIIARSRATGAANLHRLHAVIRSLPDLFELDRPRNLAFSCLRFIGPEGATGFALRMAREAGVLTLPMDLWLSPLAMLPCDRLRLGLGHAQCGPALAALEAACAASLAAA